jgi:5-methyltetrahydropteroyltriglutamate--homocysteine methyltransferase
MKTTTLGAFPKPDCVPLRDWFAKGRGLGPGTTKPTASYVEDMAALGDDAERLLMQGTREVIEDQVAAGIDILTDGEVRRENYVHYHCRQLDGFDFDRLTHIAARQGAYVAELPTITGPVVAGAPFLPADWRKAQSLTDRPLKMTLPGPMTIGDTVADVYYDGAKKRGADLAAALNREVLALAEAGCLNIQIDEPIFARKAGEALDFGFENIERCFHGLPAHVTTTVHMCCGYPDHLDQHEYLKAPQSAYLELADAIEQSSIQAISIEDAHRNNELKLLEKFTKTTVVLGVVTVASSRIETVDEIRSRLRAALDHIGAERLIAAPDCGLGMLTRDMAIAKLTNMATAARSLD